MTNAGAKFIARGCLLQLLKNGIMQRTVIAEFETTEIGPPLHSPVMHTRQHLNFGDVERDVRIIEGFE